MWKQELLLDASGSQLLVVVPQCPLIEHGLMLRIGTESFFWRIVGLMLRIVGLSAH